MRVDEVRARLSTMPRHLPPMPSELMPVVLGDGDSATRRIPSFPNTERRTAAVLILIFPGPDDEARIVLIERSAGDHRHAGQISLPGGAIDPTDESVSSAALREAREEVALDPEQAGVAVVGVLPIVDVRVSGFLVHPVVAFAERPPVLTPDDYEVASVFTAPLSAFLPGSPIEIVTAERDGFRLRYGAYRIDQHLVWGATAMMLGRFGAYLAESGP